jgi:hypothetical protein
MHGTKSLKYIVTCGISWIKYVVNYILTFIIVVWFFSLNKKGSFTEGAFLISLCKNAVTVATGYLLDGPGIRIPMWAGFSAPVQTGSVVHPASFILVFLGVKRSGRGVDHQPPPNAEVKRVQLYLYSSLWAFVACSRVKRTFTFTVVI